MGVEGDFEIIEYDPYTASDEERSWYKEHVHPHGTVPALVDVVEHRILTESGAICLYLAERYQSLLPPDDTIADYFE